MGSYADYISALEKEIDYWRKKHDRAQERANYWAKMYDELLDIKNAELDDKWKPVSQTQAEIPLREAKIEVNGQTMQVNERQLKALWGLPENEPLTDKEFKTMVSSYKAQKTSDFATRNARQQEKLVKEIAEMIQQNPWELLQRAGYNPRALAEEYLAQAIEEEMLPENESERGRA